MIVNRSTAEQAWHTLSQTVGTQWALPFDEVTEAIVKDRYRYCCKFVHPDMPTGNIKDFASVDRAKHLLLEWLSKQNGPKPKVGEPVRCNHCLGNGYVVRKGQRGFKVTSLRVQCDRCKGSGEEGVEHDRGDWG